MRTRSRVGAVMSEGPVAMGGSSSTAEALNLLTALSRDDHQHSSVDPVGDVSRRSMYGPSFGSGSASGALPGASGSGAPAGPYRCPGLSTSGAVAGRMAPSVSEPWRPNSPPFGYPRFRLAGFENLPFGDDSNYVRTLERGSVEHSRGAPFVGLRGEDARDGSVPLPLRMPLERADNLSEASSVGVSSFSDSTATNAALAELRIGNNEDHDASETEAPAAASAAVAARPTSTRQSSRAAARRATARIHAAIHSNGMVDMDDWGTSAENRESVTRGGSTAVLASGGHKADSNDDDEDDDDAAVAEESLRPVSGLGLSDGGRDRARIRAGPKTTGEESTPGSSSEPHVGLRRSIRKRNVSSTGSKEDDAGGGLKSAVESNVKKETEEDEEKPSCCICLEIPERYELSSLNGCEHHYCFACIEKWADRENTCPQCKKRFTKIERVHKPPCKRRRKGDVTGTCGRAKNSKKVKNRDQRADVQHVYPFQGLLATIDAGGAMPQSIARLIFSGFGNMNGGFMSSARQGGISGTGQSPNRNNRFRDYRDGVNAFPLQPIPTPLSMLNRLSSANQEGPSGAGSAPAHFPGVFSVRVDGSSSAGDAASRAPSSAVHLPDPWSLTRLDRSPTAPSSSAYRHPHSSSGVAVAVAAHSASSAFPSFRLDSTSGASDEDEEFGSFVQRARHLSQERSATANRFSLGPSPRGVAFAPGGSQGTAFGGGQHSRMGHTAATALEIDDDSDDEVIEVIDVHD